jgi:hypothetical protein
MEVMVVTRAMALLGTQTMEVMVVTRAMALLGTQTFTDVCFLNGSMRMLRKIENGWFGRQWLE